MERLSKQAALSMLGDSSFKSGIDAADVQTVKERYAMQLWLVQTTDISEIFALEKNLKRIFLEAAGIPVLQDEKVRVEMLSVMFGQQEKAVQKSCTGQRQGSARDSTQAAKKQGPLRL